MVWGKQYQGSPKQNAFLQFMNVHSKRLFKGSVFMAFGYTISQIARMRWAHVGSRWKCGRRHANVEPINNANYT